MGLDMYLTRRVWVQGNKNIKVLDLGQTVRLDKVREIIEEAGYWRKANAIHDWFVQNVQDGNDDCGSYYVSNEKLKELRSLCKKVLRSHKLAEDLLPTSSGFFFGGTEYDQSYFQDLKETIEIIDDVLEANKDGSGSIYYQSSW